VAAAAVLVGCASPQLGATGGATASAAATVSSAATVSPAATTSTTTAAGAETASSPADPAAGQAADRILFFGDSQPWNARLDRMVNPIWSRVTTAMLERGGGLAVGAGDYIYAKYWTGGTPAAVDTRAVLDRRYRAFRKNERRLRERMPVLLAVGNHEGVDVTADNGLPWAGTAAWQAAFDLPSAPGAGERYYSRDWRGEVHIVVLFSTKQGLGFAGPGRPGNSAQASWLIRDLRRDRHAWTIVVLHHPLYDPRWGHAWYRDPTERDRLAAFLRAQGVDLVVQGHDHFYRRHVQDGVPYVTQGGAGGLLAPALFGDAHDAERYSEYGFSELQFRDGLRTVVLRAWIVEDDGSLRLGDEVPLEPNPRH
jgi:hypothetical protein